MKRQNRRFQIDDVDFHSHFVVMMRHVMIRRKRQKRLVQDTQRQFLDHSDLDDDDVVVELCYDYLMLLKFPIFLHLSKSFDEVNFVAVDSKMFSLEKEVCVQQFDSDYFVLIVVVVFDFVVADISELAIDSDSLNLMVEVAQEIHHFLVGDVLLLTKKQKNSKVN
jgi:hypothetical protein